MTHVLKTTASNGTFIAITRENMEAILDKGFLYVKPYPSIGRFYKVRRNGMTKLWQRPAGKFRIPAKFGFRGTLQITNEYLIRDAYLDPAMFRHEDDLREAGRGE